MNPPRNTASSTRYLPVIRSETNIKPSVLLCEQNIKALIRQKLREITLPFLRCIFFKELNVCFPVNVTTRQPCIHMHPTWKLHKGALRVTGSRFRIQHFHMKWRDHLILQSREKKHRLFDLSLSQNQFITGCYKQSKDETLF